MNNVTELLTFAVNNGAEQVLISAGSPPAMRRQGDLFFAKMGLGTHTRADDAIRGRA